jgi:ribonucleoside-diphosphate reductase alpha chain
VARLASLILRINSPLPSDDRLRLLIDQLEGLGGGDSAGFGPERVLSMPDGVARGLRKLVETLEARRDAQAQEEAEKAAQAQVEARKKPSQGSSAKSNGKGNGHGNGNGNGNGHGHAFCDICPSCHQASFYRSEGCQKCLLCGFSKC